MQKAILPAENTLNGKWADNKELIAAYKVVARKGGEWCEPVTVRIWMSRASTASVAYCTIWTHDGARTFNGHGTAGGYGYHRTSAALAAAIRNAGIKLAEDIGGRGESAMFGAIEAIARALGYRKGSFKIVSV